MKKKKNNLKKDYKTGAKQLKAQDEEKGNNFRGVVKKRTKVANTKRTIWISYYKNAWSEVHYDVSRKHKLHDKNVNTVKNSINKKIPKTTDRNSKGKKQGNKLPSASRSYER